MTNQETFDFVCTKLLKQGAPAYERNMCRYRTADGRRCAVGWLIDDSEYSPGFEGGVVMKSSRIADEKSVAITALMRDKGYDCNFLYALQSAHDDSQYNSEKNDTAWRLTFRMEARKVASDFGLSDAVLGAE